MNCIQRFLKSSESDQIDYRALIPALKILSNKTLRPILLHVPIPNYPRPILVIGSRVLEQDKPTTLIYLEVHPETRTWVILSREKTTRSVSRNSGLFSSSPVNYGHWGLNIGPYEAHLGKIMTSLEWMSKMNMSSLALNSKQFSFRTCLLQVIREHKIISTNPLQPVTAFPFDPFPHNGSRLNQKDKKTLLRVFNFTYCKGSKTTGIQKLNKGQF